MTVILGQATSNGKSLLSLRAEATCNTYLMPLNCWGHWRESLSSNSPYDVTLTVGKPAPGCIWMCVQSQLGPGPAPYIVPHKHALGVPLWKG